MKRFCVYLTVEATYRVSVLAKNEEDAYEKAVAELNVTEHMKDCELLHHEV